MSRTYHHRGSYEDSQRRINKGWLTPYYFLYYYGRCPKWYRKLYHYQKRVRQINKKRILCEESFPANKQEMRLNYH